MTRLPGPPVGVAEDQVAGVRVVVVHALVHQAHPQQVAVEGHGPLRVLHDQRHVVDPGDPQPSGLFHLADATTAQGRQASEASPVWRQTEGTMLPGVESCDSDRPS